MSEWQDISTAPMDGTTVDLWCRRSWEPPQTHERSVDMYWCNTHKCWRQRGHEHYVDQFWTPKEGYKPRYLIPELWRDINLPKPT